MRVMQLLPTIAYGDAVGNDVRALRDIIAGMGYETAIYAENIDTRLPVGTALPFAEFPKLAPDDVLLYHGSTGSAIHRHLSAMGGQKLMRYHNITPPSFFAPYNRAIEEGCRRGLEEIRSLSDQFTYCMADSTFNRADLRKMDYRCPIDVCPILIPFEDYAKEPNRKLMRKYSGDGVTNILFVGRIAPNKKQEDLIRAFYYYKKYYNDKSRLVIAGTGDLVPPYTERLKEYAETLGLGKSVIFTGHIKFDEILSWYRLADLFLCMSEHEGFCVPLLEAMYFRVPILAYASCAVPDTLGDGGELLRTKDPRAAAAKMHEMVSGDYDRKALAARQEKRLETFSYDRVRARFTELLSDFIVGKPRETARRVVQFVTELNYGDAVGNDVLAIQRILAEADYACGVYAAGIKPRVPDGVAALYHVMPPMTEKDVALHHMATKCALDEVVKQLPGRLVMRYHNITPPRFFHNYNDFAERMTAEGLQQIRELSPFVDRAMPDSDFNAADLRNIGYSCPMDVLPPLIPFEDYAQEPSEAYRRKLRDGRTNILYVGRLAPNKKVEDVIAAFHAYRLAYDADARLVLAGSFDETERYYQELRGQIRGLGEDGVIFTGHISFRELLACYVSADMLLCMSEHEGFCVPLVEAMYFDVPIIAYDCAAVPDTLGGSGVLVQDKNPERIAAEMDRLMKDAQWRDMVRKGQRRRLEDFSYVKMHGRLLSLVEQWTEDR